MTMRIEIDEPTFMQLYRGSFEDASPEQKNIALFQLHEILENKLDRIVAHEEYTQKKKGSSKS